MAFFLNSLLVKVTDFGLTYCGALRQPDPEDLSLRTRSSLALEFLSRDFSRLPKMGNFSQATNILENFSR